MLQRTERDTSMRNPDTSIVQCLKLCVGNVVCCHAVEHANMSACSSILVSRRCRCSSATCCATRFFHPSCDLMSSVRNRFASAGVVIGVIVQQVEFQSIVVLSGTAMNNDNNDHSMPQEISCVPIGHRFIGQRVAVIFDLVDSMFVVLEARCFPFHRCLELCETVPTYICSSRSHTHSSTKESHARDVCRVRCVSPNGILAVATVGVVTESGRNYCCCESGPSSKLVILWNDHTNQPISNRSIMSRIAKESSKLPHAQFLLTTTTGYDNLRAGEPFGMKWIFPGRPNGSDVPTEIFRVTIGKRSTLAISSEAPSVRPTSVIPHNFEDVSINVIEENIRNILGPSTISVPSTEETPVSVSVSLSEQTMVDEKPQSDSPNADTMLVTTTASELKPLLEDSSSVASQRHVKFCSPSKPGTEELPTSPLRTPGPRIEPDMGLDHAHQSGLMVHKVSTSSSSRLLNAGVEEGVSSSTIRQPFQTMKCKPKSIVTDAISRLGTWTVSGDTAADMMFQPEPQLELSLLWRRGREKPRQLASFSNNFPPVIPQHVTMRMIINGQWDMVHTMEAKLIDGDEVDVTSLLLRQSPRIHRVKQERKGGKNSGQASPSMFQTLTVDSDFNDYGHGIFEINMCVKFPDDAESCSVRMQITCTTHSGDRTTFTSREGLLRTIPPQMLAGGTWNDDTVQTAIIAKTLSKELTSSRADGSTTENVPVTKPKGKARCEDEVDVVEAILGENATITWDSLDALEKRHRQRKRRRCEQDDGVEKGTLFTDHNVAPSLRKSREEASSAPPTSTTDTAPSVAAMITAEAKPQLTPLEEKVELSTEEKSAPESPEIDTQCPSFIYWQRHYLLASDFIGRIDDSPAHVPNTETKPSLTTPNGDDDEAVLLQPPVSTTKEAPPTPWIPFMDIGRSNVYLQPTIHETVDQLYDHARVGKLEREIIVVDETRDLRLQSFIQQCDRRLRAILDTFVKAEILLTLVAYAMGGKWLEPKGAEATLMKLRQSLGSTAGCGGELRGALNNELGEETVSLVGTATTTTRTPSRASKGSRSRPIRNTVLLGEVTEGVCRHRSILYKLLCEKHGIPCFLLRGEFRADPKDVDGEAEFHCWNLVGGHDGSLFLADPTLSPEVLLPWPDPRYTFSGPRLISPDNWVYIDTGLNQVETGDQLPTILLPRSNSSNNDTTSNGTSSSTISLPFASIMSSHVRTHEVLGVGATARVLRCTMMKGAATFALKLPRTPEDVPSLLHEHRLLQRLGSHPNTVRALGWCPGILMEYLPFSLLHFCNQLVLRKMYMSHHQRLMIVRGVAAALEATHHHGYVHRDIKPENILLAVDRCKTCVDYGLICRGCRISTVKLSDFADAIVLPSPSPGHQKQQQRIPYMTGLRVGTHPYSAPEIESCRPFSFGADLWSLGMLMMEIVEMRLPTQCNVGKNEALPATYVNAASVTATTTKELPSGDRARTFFVPDAERMLTPVVGRQPPSPSWVDVTRRCLSVDPRCRPTAAEVVQILNTEDSTVTD